jgi:hypothetical protein
MVYTVNTSPTMKNRPRKLYVQQIKNKNQNKSNPLALYTQTQKEVHEFILLSIVHISSQE